MDDCGSGIAEVQQVQQKPMQSGQGQSMRPARDKTWVQTSAARLQLLIAQVLPPLAAHPRMAVRTALAQGQPAALHPVLYLSLLLTLYARPVSHGRLVYCQKVFTECTVPLLTLAHSHAPLHHCCADCMHCSSNTTAVRYSVQTPYSCHHDGLHCCRVAAF